MDDFSPEAGDIKYVWEKSRFCFLYDLIRYDYHFEEDQSETVFRLITHWIDNNPVNCGPNWKCSQEIALRILNWTFALHYYRKSPTLNQRLLDKILCSIYDQMWHVVSNIRFSQVALKNNHLLTEALGLYTVGLLMPFLPRAMQWRNKGKFIFETEVCEQIARDGTFLQFSMNYHRVVIQLMTWGIRLSERNGDRLCDTVYSRAKASLIFLRTCQVNINGRLPNYGHNDGALFFPLSERSFGDFRPQMMALANVLGRDLDYREGNWNEESVWLTGGRSKSLSKMCPRRISSFPIGGYHIIRDTGTLTFLRCGKYDTRPFQADNNHLDIWINGRNILRDAGTWLYNADQESMRYFSGTRGHNTIMIGDFDQMQKRHRFIWTHWITNAKGKVGSSGNEYWIEAEFEGFRHLGKGIVHKRRVVKKVGQLHWVVEDYVQNVPKGAPIRQLWHPDEAFDNDFTIRATDEHGNEIPQIIESGWYSKMYGEREECKMVVFETLGHYVRTVIVGH
ncbi:alginate lyase family protein [Dyadobacter sp.]|uniref:alginate lyase family protein n=1 Tax=Dyadobacter sp. TaxID=1914288 RepID=UPI0025B87C31|nr:alginate lyase family protein [Dyadobacter sp.]